MNLNKPGFYLNENDGLIILYPNGYRKSDFTIATYDLHIGSFTDTDLSSFELRLLNFVTEFDFIGDL